MKTRVLTLGLVLVGVAAACGGSSSDDTLSGGSSGSGGGSSGSSGKAGASGSSGTAGKAGASGAAGSGTGGTGGASAGAAGTAGASGGGTAGNGGSAGASGGAGTAGTAGASGAAGKAGTAGASGAAGAAGSAGASGNAGSGGGTVDPNPVTFCSAAGDCAANQTNKVCDPTVGKCVGCVPSSDTCPKGQYCQPATKQCASGCSDAGDCAAPTPLCDTATNSCKACLLQTDCASGKICVKGSCTTGCDATKPCDNAAESCCDASCHDLKTDVNNCGKCGVVCADANNAKGTCKAGVCAVGSCAQGFADCNLDPSDGCEVNTALGGACVCKPGETKPCYTGPAGTEGKGACKGGVQQCAPSGLGFLPGCIGQVLPQPEQCGSQDLNCDGAAGNVPDVDGDGWTACQGDCCEDTTQCATPKDVNPGAIDVLGDGVDNDCSGAADNAPAACSSSAKFAGVQPSDLAAAMELCQTATADPKSKWGVISSAFKLANGNDPSASQLNNMQNNQAAVLTHYGSSGNNVPRKGPTMVGMSSGKMRDQTNPDYTSPSTSYGSNSTPPAVYLAAHGNALPSSAGCSGSCPAGSGANDSVLLRLQLKSPTNAKSFSYDFRFFSYEYYVYQCTSYNDFYLALLTQGGEAGKIPADKNISFDSKNNPVSVNNGFFDVCTTKGCNACPNGTGDLSQTGMQQNNYGGATKWLTTTAPINAGEVITLDLTIFDVSDNILDSLVLVDNFQYLATPSGPPTTKPAQ